MYNHAIEIGKLPETLELALITVLPEPGKDPKLCSSYRPISLLSTSKAFDRIEWPHLYEVMNRMNLGPTFCKLVKMLYRCPMAKIQTNNDISSKITLSCSTRQGCGRSPLLFALAIEPLAEAIRSHPLIKGKQIGGDTLKFCYMRTMS